MNFIVRYATVLPAFIKFFRGGVLLYDGKFEEAFKKLEACKNHPNFQNELFFSYYGQTLCGLGRLDEGHSYLIKACKKYQANNWVFENDYAKNVAAHTLDALAHVIHETTTVEGRKYLSCVPVVKGK